MKASSDERPAEAEIRERRLEVARRNSHWTEVEEAALVRRGRVLVHAETDEVFTLYRAPVFQTGSITVIPERFPMFWYLDRAGVLVFLERQSGTWTERFARQERRRAEQARA